MEWLQILHRRVLTLITRLRFSTERVRVGAGLTIGGTVPRCSNSGTIRIGAGVCFRSTGRRIILKTLPTGNIAIGDGVFFNDGCLLYSASDLDIGSDTRIANGVILMDSSFHPVHEGGPSAPRPIRIGRNVWLGRNVMVMPGVDIGDHSVVAAGSVVFENIPARQVWRGNPASYVKDVRASPDWRRP